MKKNQLHKNILSFICTLVIILISFCVFENPVNAEIVNDGDVQNFGYTGGIQQFVVPYTGYYQLEAWGAAGGGPSGYRGGFGGYSTGAVRLNKNDVVYVVVGGAGKGATAQGQTLAGGYNGGGKVNGNGGVNHMTGSGGGATHFATVSGVLSSLSGFKGTYSSITTTYDSNVILLVAGGGGGGRNQDNHVGAARWGVGASGGGNRGGYLTSNYGGTGQNKYLNESATQNSGYSFGQGGNGSANAAGGGGFFGGYAGDGAAGYFGSGGGGSGFIGSSNLISYKNVEKHMVCYDCVATDGESIKTINSTTYNSTAISDTPKSGAGAGVIRLIEKLNTNPNLASLTFEKGLMNREFDPEVYEYDVVFASDDSTTNITAIPEDLTSVVVGDGSYNVESGTHDLTITSTSESGDVALYLVHVTRPASSYKYLNNILISGEGIVGFNPTKLEYNINVPYDYDELNVDVIKGRTSQTVYLPSDTHLNSGNNTKNIIVVSEDGNSTTNYTLNINRAHSSLLKSLSFNDYELASEFDSETLEYTLNIMSSTMALKVNALAYDEEATVTLSGFGYIKKSGVGTITVTEPNSEKTVYKIVINKESSVATIAYDFPYTGGIQTFTAPYTGYYYLETWGAQGGNISGYTGGFGGYANGVVYLNKNDELFIVVGGAGKGATGPGQSLAGGYNGGGSVSGNVGVNHITGSGGGATHIATTNRGVLSNYNEHRDELMIVSGAGGGARNQANHEPAARWGNGGSGGGAQGGALTSNYNSNTLRSYTSTAGTQTSGNAFGLGGSVTGNSAGGGGFFGGKSGYSGVYYGTGAGGSGYIGNNKLISYKEYTKSMYCYNCTQSSNEDTYTVNTSKYSSTPTSFYAKSGDGHARVTMLAQPSENNFLSKLTVKATTFDPSGDGVLNEKTYTPVFDMAEEDYYVVLNKDETSVTISAKPEDVLSIIDGLGTYDIEAGETIIPITVTAESGSQKEYRVHVTREKDDNQYPFDIQVAGLVPSLCGNDSMYCNQNDIIFDKDTHTYYLTVTSRIKQLWFNVYKNHPYQIVNGDGKVTLKGGENTFTITITSEDEQNHSVYNYVVTRDMTGNNDLSQLNILNPEREINYDPDILEYYISIPNEIETYQINTSNEKDDNLLDVLQIYVEQDDEHATYLVSGTNNFEVGMNQVLITVTAANGEIKTYVLNVYREKNSNVFLSDLSVSKGDTTYELSPEFNKINLGTYNVTVPNEISEVEIHAQAEVNTTIVSGIGNKNLNTGNNEYNIVTTSESGDTENYKINIYREKNSNAYLKELHAKVNEVEKIDSFNKNTLEYSFSVEEGVNEVTIEALPEVSTTTYRLLDNNKIRVGENKKRVMAVAEDGTTLIYEIIINRPLSTDNDLQSLIVYDENNTYELSPEFDKDVLEYELIVENEVSSVNVLGTKNNTLAQVSGNGKYSLQVGENKINVSVTSESQDVKIYEITITRKANSNANLSLVRLSTGDTIVPENINDNEELTVTLSSNIKEVELQGLPEVNTTKVEGNGKYTLVTGENEFELTTKAEDEVSTKNYKVIIAREESNNNKLSNLILKEGALSPIFSKDNEQYSAIVPYSKDKAHFIVELDDEKSTYEILNDELEVGENTVTIKVTAENNDEKEYKVNITRLDEETSRNTRLLKLKTDVGTLTPTFNAENLYYEVEVEYDVKNITVTAEAEVEYSSVIGIGTYSLNVGENLITVRVTSADMYTRDYQIMVKRAKNTEARLSSLIVEGSALTPIFDKDIYEYDLQTKDDHLTFTSIVPVDSNATYEIDGNEFTEAKNYVVKIKVIAQDGKSLKEYKLNVNKLPSNNNNLSSLEVEGYTINPAFSPNVTVYNLEVENDVNSINIVAKTSDANATINGDGMQTVSVGENHYTVEVTSQSGKVKNYIIIVNKAGSNNTNITNLEVRNGTMSPVFDNAINNYNVEIEYNEERLDLSILLEDEKATYEVVGNKDLKEGNNVVKVIIHAENNQTREINLNVIRKSIVSALLKSLKLKNYEINPEFNSYVSNYNVTVDNEIDNLVFDRIETLDSNATYEVKNNQNLAVGNNAVEIEVTSSNGIDKETYTINVNKQAYSNTYLDYLYTNLGDVTPTYSKTTMEYNIEVEHEKNSIELFAEAVDKSAKVETIYNGITKEAQKEEGKYTGELGTFNLNTGNNKVSIIVTSQSGIKRKYYLNIYRKADDNNYLTSLNVKIGATNKTLTPEFEKNETNYEVNVEEGTPSINVQGVAESEMATVEGNGIYSLRSGENIIKINVTGESGITRVYTIKVNRPASNNNHLIELIPSNGELDPEFSYDVDPSSISDRTYTLNLDSSVAYLSFEAITEDDNATIEGLERILVPDGTSQRVIKVIAEDETTREYIINVNKERTDDASLSNLYVNGYDFVDEDDNVVVFDKDIHDYYIKVPNSKIMLLQSDVEATTTDKNARITKASNLSLQTKTDNVYTVIVTAPDGFTKETYKIHVERGLNNVSTLNNLVVNKGHLTSVFNPNVKEYTWMVPKNTVLNEASVTAIPTDVNATINKTPYLTYVEGEENTYEVQVVAEDGSTSTTYKLHLELDLSTDATLSSLKIDKGYYEPEFNPETKEYDVYEYIDTDKINIDATPTTETSEILSGNGEIELTSDVNVHYIIVQAEDGTEETYTLNIHRSILKDETLTNIGLNNLPEEQCINDKCILTPAFNEDVVSYKIKVPYEYEKLDVLYETKNEQQKVKLKVGENYIENGNYSLVQGKTKVLVEVYDGLNKLTKTYELEVERCKSSNTYLSNLEIEEYELEPEFNKEIQEYTIYIDKNKNEFSLDDFIAIPEFDGSRVVINGYTYLEEGNNDITLEVIAPDGSTREYIVHAIKAGEYDSRLRNITVSTGVFHSLSPEFKSTTYEYTVTVPGNVERATIEAFAMDTETEVYDAKKEIELVTGNNIVTIRTNNHGQGNTYTVNIIKQPNTDVDLISLVIDEGNISPTFERSTTKYNVNVDEDTEKLTIHATPSSKEAIVTITGNERLRSGKNTVNVIVQNKDKTMSKTYQLTVNKALSSNNRLSEIKVFDDDNEYSLDPEFEEDMHYYKVVVNDDIEKVTVDAKASNELATVTGIGEEYLEYGDNIKEITVTAENGNVDTYRVNIHRNYNLNLKELTSDVGELSPEFDGDETEYEMEVEKDVEEITLIASSESNKVTTTGTGTYNLNPGENEIEIIVTAPDGSSKTYTVIVNKKLDDNNYIKDLQLEGIISPIFEKETLEYEVNVRKNIKELIFNKIELESEKATYEVIGNSNFTQNNNPNEVIIKVTSESQKEREYKLKVYLREDEYFSNRLLSLTIDNGQLTPDFNPDINNYATTVANSIDKLTIETIKENEHSTVKIKNILGGTRTIPLNLGRNEIPIVVTSQDERENIYSLIVYRSESQDATLKSLTVENQNYSPIFNKDTMEYSLEVGSEVKNLNVVAVPSDPNSRVLISGNTNLVSGINIIKIKVTAPDNITEKEYKITVNKSVSRNNYLSSLEVLDYELDKQFIKTNQGPYLINVETNVESVMVKATPEVETTTIIGDGKINLSKGRNVINVEATAESGDKRTYTIIVNRAYNNDVTLKNILLSDGELEPIFNSSTHTYEVEVDESVEEITITGILNDSNATIQGNDTYDITENEETNINLVVTAEDKTTKETYKIKVIRHINASSYLSKLIVKDGELYPNFHKLITAYTILVPNEVRSLEMVYEPEDELASVEISGNQSFKVGTNKVYIDVRAKDNSSTTRYEISVVRQSKASNYLKTLDISGYQLQPTFNKETMYYEVNVPENVDTVNVFAEAEDTTAMIDSTDLGMKSINPGENRFYITVESQSGAIRTYQVLINRSKSTENKLLTLESDIGTWDQEFDSEVNSYTITVPEKTSKITLDGTASANSNINGLGTSDVNVGSQTRTITVTSQSGEINTYTVTIVRPSSNNVNLISLTPSVGTLDPSFDNNINDYEIEVSDSTRLISFDVVPEDEDAKVEGNDITILDYGENNITITVHAEDQTTTKDIHIKVTRVKDLISIIPSENEVLLEKNETKEITYTLNPLDATYSDVEWKSLDSTIATVENGVITGKKYGSTSVRIVSKHDENIYATITVNVVNKLITSSVYEVYHFEEDDEENENYVIGFEPKTKISDIINDFDNNENTLHFYDKEDNEILAYEEIITTGTKIKLIINDKEYDSVTIVVRGDINMDGIINVNDNKKLNNFILKTINFNYIERKAADLNKDNIINVTDYKKLNNYILKTISTVN